MEEQFLTWQSAGTIFGMTLADCREVKDRSFVQKVPCSRPYVCGIANLRGDVVTVLDLALMLGYETEASPDSEVHLVRLKDAEQNVCLKVDRLSDIIKINDSVIEPAPANFSAKEAALVRQVARLPEGMLLILDRAAFLRPYGEAPGPINQLT